MRRLLAPLLLLSAVTACVTLPPVPQPVPVFFRNASVELGPEARQQVAAAAAVANQYPALRVSLVGYGLPTGVPSEPERLASARASAVQRELVRDGVASARIQGAVGGALPPPPDTPVESRRVDITFNR